MSHLTDKVFAGYSAIGIDITNTDLLYCNEQAILRS